MINTLHTGNTTSTELAPLIDRLTKKVDANKDGQVSAGEFTEFLTSLLQKISHTGLGHEHAPLTPPASAQDAAAAAAGPATLTPNYILNQILAAYPPASEAPPVKE